MKRLSILGATGSIGTQTLDVVRAEPEAFRVDALTTNRNIALLEEQIREFHPRLAVVADEALTKELKLRVKDTDTRIASGKEGMVEAATVPEADMVVTAVVGFAGLVPTLAAMDAGKDIALANKETLVTAGEIVMARAKEKGVSILPVDSEHSAIFQSLQGQGGSIRKILLTASGGPFYGKTKEELRAVTPEDALKHPNWDMGNKITIDSATLMNKGLEVIEAVRLFGVSPEDVTVLVHRESILHSAVEFCDHSIIGQLGLPDMRLPISYALHYPARGIPVGKELDLFQIGELTFRKPDRENFPCLDLALRAVREGGIMPTVMNAANEVMVEAFLSRKCGFLEIAEGVKHAMNQAKNILNPTVQDIIDSDALLRQELRKEVFA